jgi:hypothetical protein
MDEMRNEAFQLENLKRRDLTISGVNGKTVLTLKILVYEAGKVKLSR